MEVKIILKCKGFKLNISIIYVVKTVNFWSKMFHRGWGWEKCQISVTYYLNGPKYKKIDSNKNSKTCKRTALGWAYSTALVYVVSRTISIENVSIWKKFTRKKSYTRSLAIKCRKFLEGAQLKLWWHQYNSLTLSWSNATPKFFRQNNVIGLTPERLHCIC